MIRWNMFYLASTYGYMMDGIKYDPQLLITNGHFRVVRKYFLSHNGYNTNYCNMTQLFDHVDLRYHTINSNLDILRWAKNRYVSNPEILDDLTIFAFGNQNLYTIKFFVKLGGRFRISTLLNIDNILRGCSDITAKYLIDVFNQNPQNQEEIAFICCQSVHQPKVLKYILDRVVITNRFLTEAITCRNRTAVDLILNWRTTEID